MRVLFVDHSSEIAGAELVLLDIAARFPRGAVWLFGEGPLRARLELAGVQVRVPRRPLRLERIRRGRGLGHALTAAGTIVRAGAGIMRAARAHDLVYANSQKAFVIGAVAARMARRSLIWHLHDIMSRDHFGSAQISLAIGLANRCAARVIVPSRHVADAFAAAGGEWRKIRIVPNGLPAPAKAADRAAVRRQLGLAANRFAFAVCSRLARWKGQHVAIRALAKFPDATCVIAGAPLFGEQDYADELQRLAVECGVADRVLWLGHRDDVRWLMGGMDAIVHPSIAPEPFGRTLVEAMLAGVPVVAANTGAAAEILDHGRAGLLVPPADPAALAQALERLRANPDRACETILAAQRRARVEYGLERMHSGVAAVLREVMAEQTAA